MPIFSSEIVGSLNLHMTNLFTSFKIHTKYGALAVTTTPIIIFSGIYLAWAYARQYYGWKRKQNVGRVFTRSLSLGVLHSGKLALERLIDYHKVRVNAEIFDGVLMELRDILEEEHPHFRKLQNIVAKLEMSGKEAEAVELLEKAVEKAQKEGRQHEAYEFEMPLVELLIYKGEYEKVLGRQCLAHQEISDSRRPLYKATIQVLLNQPKEEAEKEWNNFRDIRRCLQLPPDVKETRFYKIITNFNEFLQVIKLLQTDFQEDKTK